MAAAPAARNCRCTCATTTTRSTQLPVESLIPGGGGIPANAWATATLDFDSAGLTFGTFNCFVIMDADGNNDVASGQPAAYIDQIVFNPRTTAPPGGGTVNVSVNATANVRPVNPLIFGVAYGDAARNAQMGYTVDRWGGNSATRYNWQVDVHSTAFDYYYENIPGATDRSQVPPLGNDADAFVGAARSAGSDVLMTIPTIGWTPRADSPLDHPYFAGFSVAKYGAQQSTDPYDLDAGNGVRADGTLITGNDPTDTSAVVDANFQKPWVAHLQATFGGAANGGVKFYALDNEVMLWNSTHRDVHPQPTDLRRNLGQRAELRLAIKQQDPGAQVTGPVTWGYCDLFGSAADNCVDGADRQAHGGVPFVAWYLQQVCANPLERCASDRLP